MPPPPKTGSRKPARAGKRTPRSASTGANGSASNATASGPGSGRKGKFNAAGEHVDGKWMASATEAERYRQLLRMHMAGQIDNLVTQPSFDLVVNNKLICRYRADFRYDIVTERGEVLRTVIEDVKGFVTPEFLLKHKLFDALHPVPLSLIYVHGNARHPDRPDQPASRVGWIAVKWGGMVPDRNNDPSPID